MKRVTLTDAEQLVRAASGRTTFTDGLLWLGEGRPAQKDPGVTQLLEALLTIADEHSDGKVRDDADKALKAVCRQRVRSALDPSVEVLALDNVTRPATYRQALDDVASRTPTRDLSTVNLAAVAAAQQHNPNVVEALCALSGLSYRDLKARADGVALPGSPAVSWKHEQISAAFKVIDAIISGTVTASTPAASPMRPVEHLVPSVDATPAPTGWALVEHFRTQGVPLEVLLAQRAVGSAWGAHRNSTNGLVPAAITGQLVQLLRDREVPHDELRRDGASRELLAKAGANGAAADGDDEKAGGQITVLVHTNGFAHGIAVSVARDGGTARASGAKLMKLPSRLGIQCSVVVVGPGWSTRNETADLARAFGGRMYTEQTLPDLADWLQEAAVGPSGDNDTTDTTTAPAS